VRTGIGSLGNAAKPARSRTPSTTPTAAADDEGDDDDAGDDDNEAGDDGAGARVDATAAGVVDDAGEDAAWGTAATSRRATTAITCGVLPVCRPLAKPQRRGTPTTTVAPLR
jgi:hypothetical protein